jgi:hypothetical protein
MKTITTLKQLIEFFEAIPANKWCQGSIKKSRKHCAIGHLTRFIWDKETHDFIAKIGVSDLVRVNDSKDGLPKDNVIKFLRDLCIS